MSLPDIKSLLVIAIINALIGIPILLWVAP